MDFPLDATDELLRTTRSVRRRLDLERPVSDQTLLDCIDLAEQAPTGGNQGSRRWLVVRDPEKKAQLAELYREAGGRFMIDAAAQLAGSGHHNEKTMASAAHLAENLDRVPAIVIPTIWGEHDGSGRPGLFDSVVQAAWSFCLALRARGLGTAWTTVHLQRQDAVAELLGIPDGVTQIVLFPVAYTVGTDFRPAPRRPADEITYFDHWGWVNASPADGAQSMASGPGVTVEIDIDAPPKRIWPLVTDVDLPGRFSEEFQGGEWLDDPGPGARFRGRNVHAARGEWETISTVTDWTVGRLFGWAVGDPDNAAARWSFELEPLAGATRLRQRVLMGPGPSGVTAFIDENPEHESLVVAGRRAEHAENMARTLAGIKDLAEGT
ncbi:MAG: nitroreductase family protein [Acidimicrobiales bacterium]